MVPQSTHGRGGEAIRHIVLHYSASGGSAQDVASYFSANPARSASYHYVIGRDGVIVQCVRDEDTAWHAAGLSPGDRKVIPRRNNRRSIGICLVNWGYGGPEEARSGPPKRPVRGGRTHTWQAYTEQQYFVLRALARELRRRHPTLTGVCGHEDCAQKADPGPLFNWPALDGLGLTRHIYRHGRWRSEVLGDVAPPAQPDPKGFWGRLMDWINLH